MYLRLENVVKVFPPRGGVGEVTAVADASISIEKGQLVTLLGPSGCGKTTTLRLIGGFEFPTSGQIFLDGEEIGGLPPHKRGMGMVFQSYAIFPHLNVFENISYGLHVQKRPKAEVEERVRRVTELVELTGFEKRAPNQLSGGQQQRVALARALVMEPKVLLLDEPLSNLDAKLREQMRTEIRRIQQTLHITSVYVTHDQIEAMTLSDHVVVMNHGAIEQTGTPEQIYKHPGSRFVAGFIGRANFVPATVTESGADAVAVDCLGQRIRVTGVADRPPKGARVTAVLRPETIWIPDGKGRLQALVKRALYLGDAIEYDVEVAGQKLTFTETNPLRLQVHPPGSSIELDFHEEVIHLLPAGEPARA